MMILNCDNESVLLQSFYSSVLSQLIFILLYVCFYFNNALCCVLMKTINDLKLKKTAVQGAGVIKTTGKHSK